jgi:hypothetical protein
VREMETPSIGIEHEEHKMKLKEFKKKEKIEVDDLDWIIILFFIYLDPFKVEKIKGFNLHGHFSGKS